jgi:methyltransferase-like protein 6
LSKDTNLISEFKKNKLEIDAKKHWDLFYRRNKTNFFKDRHWTMREFDELNDTLNVDSTEEKSTNQQRKLLEIGCGVGNFIFPLIKKNKNIFVYACDFSTDAIGLLKASEDYATDRCYGFVCDVSKPFSLRENLPNNELVDVVSLIFVLSAIHPDKMKIVAQNIASVIIHFLRKLIS